MDQLNKLSGSLFNAGGGLAVSTSLLELTALCREFTGKTIPIHNQPETRVADIPVYIYRQCENSRCHWVETQEDNARSGRRRNPMGSRK